MFVVNKNGLDYGEEFEVLLEWDVELKDNYKDNEIIEDEDENTDYSKYYKIYRYIESDDKEN